MIAYAVCAVLALAGVFVLLCTAAGVVLCVAQRLWDDADEPRLDEVDRPGGEVR